MEKTIEENGTHRLRQPGESRGFRDSTVRGTGRVETGGTGRREEINRRSTEKGLGVLV